MGIEETLKRAEVFLELEDDDLDRITALPSCREVTYQANEAIFRAGDEAKYLYVLQEGQVDLVMEVPSNAAAATPQVVINTIRKGGFFGWSALVKPHSYVMSAICQKPSRIVVISGTELTQLFEKDNRIGYKVMRSLSQIIGTRLRYLEQVLATGERRPFFGKRKSP